MNSGDGLDARNLFYAIYIVGQDTPVMQNFINNGKPNYVPGSETSQPVTFESGSLSVTFSRQLLENTDYEIVFWAQSASTMGSPYSYNLGTKELSVDYSSLPSTGQSRDAFYASATFKNNGATAVSAELRRPFAQINIGASDAAEYKTNKGVTDNADLKFGLTITDVPTAINLSTGVLSDNETSVTTTLSPLTANLQYSFPAGNGYDMLATALILAPKTASALCDVTLNAAIGEGTAGALRSFNFVPVQGNYRTNIYGSLLTGETSFTVTINPDWGTPDNDNNYGVVTHEAVDLGLSVKWATCNIGANNPEDYGNYYAWGETTTKTGYIQANSEWYGTTISDLQTAGVIDDNDNLTSAYDAATANWGGGWRMPTKAECQELLDNCTWTWSAMNGNNGYTVTSNTNGNSIFLPAAGERNNDGLYGAGSGGYYWSSTADSDEKGSYGLYFSSSYKGVILGYRYRGQSVRPVIK